MLDSFVITVLILIPPQLAPLPPPSFTPNSITVILSTTTYLKPWFHVKTKLFFKILALHGTTSEMK